MLSLPASDAVMHPNTITSLHELRSWLADLPYANLPRVSVELLRALQLLNRHPAAVNRRLELMESYLAPFQQLLSQLRISPSDHASPPSRHTGSLLPQQILQICHEMAYGFKLSLRDPALQQPSAQRQKCLLLAANCLAREALIAYASYRKEPAYCWREILSIYQTASREALAETPLEDPLESTEAGITISCLVKRSALIMLLDPLRLQAGALWSASDYIGKHCSLIELTPYHRPPERPSGCFLLDCDGIDAPRPLQHTEQPTDHDNSLLLNCNALNLQVNAELKARLQGSATEAEQGSLATDLLRRMLLSWHLCQARHQPRQPADLQTLAVLGIRAIHHFLEHGAPGEMLDSSADETTIELTATVNLQEKAHYPIHCWQQTNISIGGTAVLIPETALPAASVGQPVLLVDRRQRLLLGVIRRLLLQQNGSMEAGIQFIQGVAKPVEVKPQNLAAGQPSVTHPAILLHRNQTQPLQLLAPLKLFEPDAAYLIESPEQTPQPRHAGRLLEASTSFERFELL